MRARVLPLILCILCAFIMSSPTNVIGKLSEATQMKLKDQQLIAVATQRANGEWSSRSLVWFMSDNDAVYLMTKPTSHKARRVQRGSQMQVWFGERL